MKKMRKHILFFILSLFTLNIIAAQGVEEDISLSNKDDSKSFTVTDILGREVTFNKPVEKVAFTHMATGEAIKVLGGWDMVVARDGYTNDGSVFPNLEEIPTLTPIMGSPYTDINMELLYQLNPDVLILEVIPMPGLEDLISKLDKIIPVVCVKTFLPEKVEFSMDVLGKVLGKENESKDFIEWYNSIINRLLDKTGKLSEEEKPVAFYKMGYGDVEDLMSFSDEQDFVPLRNKAAGFINYTANTPSQGGWVTSLNPEWIASNDFDILFINDPNPSMFGLNVTDTTPIQNHIDQVKAIDCLSESSAVKNKRVYMISSDLTASLRMFISFAYYAKASHPDLFKDMDPDEIHQEYLNKFLGLDVDLSESGVFFYPKVK